METVHAKQLPIPPIAAQDPRAIEMVRIWAASGKQHVSLATGLWKDPAAWGIMLVDLLTHVSNAYAQTTNENVEHIRQRIKDGFDVEWATRTDRPIGEIIRKEDE